MDAQADLSQLFAYWVIFRAFCRLLNFFKINFLEKKNQDYHQSAKQFELDPALHFVIPEVQTVCKGYQQTASVGKEFTGSTSLFIGSSGTVSYMY